MTDFTVDFTENDLIVSAELPFPKKVDAYRQAYNKLVAAKKSIDAAKSEAEKENSLSLYKSADKEEDRTAFFFVPFVAAMEQAKGLKEKGFILSSWEGEISGNGEPQKVDPIVAMFMIADEAYNPNLFGDPEVEPEVQEMSLLDAIKLIIQLLPVLQAIRDKIIPINDNGEIARLIRDPIKRPVEMIQNVRDKVISPEDTGEVAQIIRDPIKRPVEVVKNAIKKIFGW